MTHRIPTQRVEAVERLYETIAKAGRVVLTTHLNADGDGAGSQAAMASWLRARGQEVWIVNPTRFPSLFDFLVEDPEWVVDAGDAPAEEITARADLAVVLDTGEASRIGRVRALIQHLPTVVLDHHLPGEAPIGSDGIRDSEACATGELLYDLIEHAGDRWTLPMRRGIYVAIMTDTGSFRFSNSTPTAHRIVADLIEGGVDPEEMYRRVYGSSPARRYRLLSATLQTLDVDSEAGVAWVTVPSDAYDALEATAEDLDGFVDYPRSVEGVEVGLLFRQAYSGATKVSFRSNRYVDVQRLARQFGGGGHARASGALVREPLPQVRGRVIEAARRAALSERPGKGQ